MNQNCLSSPWIDPSAHLHEQPTVWGFSSLGSYSFQVLWVLSSSHDSSLCSWVDIWCPHHSWHQRAKYKTGWAVGGQEEGCWQTLKEKMHHQLGLHQEEGSPSEGLGPSHHWNMNEREPRELQQGEKPAEFLNPKYERGALFLGNE